MSDLKYWYYSKQTKLLIRLGFFDFNDNEVENINFPFTFEDSTETRVFNTENALVFFCAEHNRKVEIKYEETFKIKPPYRLRTYLDYSERATCVITYHGYFLTFKDMIAMERVNRADWSTDDAPAYDFFKQYERTTFDIWMLMRFHFFALKNAVFTPYRASYERRRFNVKMQGSEFTASVHKHNLRAAKPYFLNFDRTTNSEVFRYYHISHSELACFFHGEELVGDWPFSDEETVYDIINYINRTKYANFVANETSIDDNVVQSQFGTFTIEQTINSTWYLRGDLDNILRMFKLNSKDELKAYMNGVLGEKRRSGVFPECETKEEIIKLIETITR